MKVYEWDIEENDIEKVWDKLMHEETKLIRPTTVEILLVEFVPWLLNNAVFDGWFNGHSLSSVVLKRVLARWVKQKRIKIVGHNLYQFNKLHSAYRSPNLRQAIADGCLNKGGE